jgi:uncharacterized delta-60 repeat protein
MGRTAGLVLGALLIVGCATGKAEKTAIEAAPAYRLWSHTFVASRADTVTAIGFARTPPGVAVVRYLPSGRVDASFRRRVHPEFGAGKLDALAAATDARGRILVAACQPPECWGYSVLGRFRPSGGLDPSFGDHGIVRTSIAGSSLTPHAIAMLRDGRIVVAGGLQRGGLTQHAFIARFLPSGQPDRAFGENGVLVDERLLGAGAVSVRADGAILVGGSGVVARYLHDGARDLTFGTGGIAAAPGFLAVTDLLTEPGGRIVVAGSALPRQRPVLAVARLTSRGTLDRGFGRSGVVLDSRPGDHWARVERLVRLPDGRLVAVGWATRGGGVLSRRYRPVVLKLTSSGQLDRSFGANGRVTIESIEAQARGAFVRGRDVLVVGPDDDLKPTRIVFARVPYR